ncbi:MAG: hypothetical protein EAY75_03625 [Bacteroidetes bacterium]|nr:MAG: hypothetical protein EAY75_03625 [Bacteroidota bacterium]
MKNDKQVGNAKKPPALALCILLDLVGMATYAIPVLGEFGDVVWAPLSGLIFYRLFGGWRGAIGGLVSFVEEALPGLDFIPTFTLAWFWQRYDAKRHHAT